ncbi:MAG: sugar transferase [Eubacterium sp.]|nr:sugar transferase [Eubacterium sp.]
MNTSSVKAKHADFILIDMISIVISLAIAYLIRTDRSEDHIYLPLYEKIVLVILALYIILMLFNSFHRNILKRRKNKEFLSVIVVNLELIFALFTYLFLAKESEVYSRQILVMFFAFDIFIMTVMRSLRKRHLWKSFREGKNTNKVIIVTYPSMLEKYLKSLSSNNNGFNDYVGIVLLDEKDGGAEDVDAFNKIPRIKKSDILEFVKANVVNEAYILADSEDGREMVELFMNMGITTHIALNLDMSVLSNTQIETIDDYTIITSSISRGSEGARLVKRVFDILVSIIGLFFTGIFYIFLAPIIKKQSPGPALFCQDRVGKNGKIFKMYKFRSMYMDAEERKKELMDKNEIKGLMFKMEDDPRIMPIGKFIRKTSLDEFPQFWNILKGDMSLVGTRPPTLDEYQQYDPHHLSRLAMKPGLTGMWQTSGRSDIDDFEEVVKLDNDYIRNFSLGLDLKIIIKTFGAVLGKKGSK